MPHEVSLSEIAFQLDRLAEEGKTAGEQGGEYRALQMYAVGGGAGKPSSERLAHLARTPAGRQGSAR